MTRSQNRRSLPIGHALLVFVVATLALSLVGVPPRPGLADGRCSTSTGGVEQRIVTFWQCVNALGSADYLAAEDLGQWARNVIERAPGAGLQVVDFRASTQGMQAALDRASIGIPSQPPKAPDVEARIAAFWQRVNVLAPCDHLTATDLGQWAINVIDRDPSKRIRVDDFRSSAAGMQAGLDRASGPCRLPTVPSTSPIPLRSDFSLTFLEPFSDMSAPPGTTGYRFVVGTGVAPEAANALRARLPDGCRTQPPLNCTWQIAFTRSPLVAELFVPSDFPVGEYVFGFTLQDGRSADAVFSTSPFAALPARNDACVQPTRADADGRAIPARALLLATDFPAICSGKHDASDASIAAGMSEVLVATNDAFALYDKAGRLIDRVSSLDMFSSVMSSAGYGWGDPRALFDRQAQRYFLAFTLSRQAIPERGPCECDLRWLLAVSRTAAPTSLRPSDWYLYAFDGTLEGGKPTSGSSGDFLVMATDARNLVLHANMAGSPSAEQSFTKLWVFDKTRLLSGSPVTRPDSEFVDVRDPLPGGPLVRLLPAAMNDDPGRVFLAGRSTSGCSLVIASVSGSAERAELTLRGVPITGACPAPPHSPQLGGGTPIWSVGDVMGQPSYAAGRIWLTHAVSAATATGSVSGIRLVELDVSRWPATPSVATDTTFAEQGVWYSFPALAANGRGDVAVVLTRSSFTEYGSVWYTGRLGTDPPGTLRPPVLLKRGEANLNRVIRASQPASGTFNKFADFAGAALDPQDGSAWFIGTYVANVCAWGTWVGRVDWSVAPRDTGAAPPPLALRAGPPCSTARRDLFTLQFSGTAAGSAYPSAPPGARAYVFTFSGADLADRALAPSVTDPTPNAGWVVSGPGTFVLFLHADRLSPGSYQLRVRLADGRETGAFFTVVPP